MSAACVQMLLQRHMGCSVPLPLRQVKHEFMLDLNMLMLSTLHALPVAGRRWLSCCQWANSHTPLPAGRTSRHICRHKTG